MSRTLGALSILVGALVLAVAAACGGDSAPAVSEEAAAPEPTAAAAPTDEEQAVDEGREAGGGDFSPLGLLTSGLPGFGGGGGGGVGGLQATDDVDAALKAVLLDGSDLPDGFSSLGGGQFSFNLPEDAGSAQMAMSMFFSDDFATTGSGSAVMSAAVAMPPELLRESLGSFSSGGDIERELRESLGQAEAIAGVHLSDLYVLDTSGLGEGGGGIHLEMDFGDLASAFGTQGGPTSMAMDMYIFSRAEHMLMVMVMWPGGEPRPIDGRSLAEIMDSRAETVF